MLHPSALDALHRFLADASGPTSAGAGASGRAPSAASLPSRTILVPTEAHAHALRRVITALAPRALLGTRFARPEALALELLQREGVDFTPGEEAHRATRLLALFHERRLGLRYFEAALLADVPGWDVAFARTLTELEAAAFTPNALEDLAASPLPADAPSRAADRLHDLALIWRALDERAARSFTPARILVEAAALVTREPAAWPELGPTLAFVTGHETAARARFLRAIPRVTLALVPSRPRRHAHHERLALLFPELAAAAATRAPASGAPSTRSTVTELALLSQFLFESPDALSAPSRPRSRGPDGTVHFEHHGGVADELEAAAQWVHREVLEHKTPLSELAILAPRLEPWAPLLRDRLATLPWPDDAGGDAADGPPVVILGGVPVARTSAGARLRALLAALSRFLPIDALSALVPALRAEGLEGRSRLGRSQAMKLIAGLGTVGGADAAPEAALEWLPRMHTQLAALERELATARDDDEDREYALRDARTRALHLRAITPSMTALHELARAIVDKQGLVALWPRLAEFVREHLVLPAPHGPILLAALEDAATSLLATDAGRSVGGATALGLLGEALWRAQRASAARFGEPAITLTTVRRAAGLSFRAVRVVGLVEGALPSPGREDPVLPDALRAWLPGVPRLGERAHADLASLVHVLEATTERVTLSASSVDEEGTHRELSPVFTEAGVALARPGRDRRAPPVEVPGVRVLAERYFTPSREDAVAFDLQHPLREASWQALAASVARLAPAHWQGPSAVGLERLLALLDPTRAPDALDGVFPKRGAFPVLPGLSPERPISPTRLGRVLGCPQAFFLSDVLGFREAAELPDGDAIDSLAYGSLFHKLAEDFYRAHGESFVAKKGTLEAHLATAEALTDALFTEFVDGYPLGGALVREAERARLQRDVAELLQYDWGSDARAFVSVEQAFGNDAPVRLETSKAERALFVQGQIDRLDSVGSKLFVRDLKTGKPKLRSSKGAGDFDPAVDLQLGVYALVAEQLARAWKVSARGGVESAYVYPKGNPQKERRYSADETKALMALTRQWLEVARSLLEARALPRTPDPQGCTYCAFAVSCHREQSGRSREVLTLEPRTKPYARFVGEEEA